MKNLSRNQWIGIIVAVTVGLGFFYSGLGPFGSSAIKETASSAVSNLSLDSATEDPAVEDENVATSSTRETDPDGLVIEDLKLGAGDQAKSGMLVTVHYTGRLLDGRTFDSSFSHGSPFQFILGSGQVIQGWERGIAGMRVGGERLLIIPAALAYGDQRVGIIPPNATLVFEVELLGAVEK